MEQEVIIANNNLLLSHINGHNSELIYVWNYSYLR